MVIAPQGTCRNPAGPLQGQNKPSAVCRQLTVGGMDVGVAPAWSSPNKAAAAPQWGHH